MFTATHYVTRFCACGYPLRLGLRWTGLAHTFLVYDGAPEPRTNARLTCCPSCGLRLTPATLLSLYRHGHIRRPGHHPPPRPRPRPRTRTQPLRRRRSDAPPVTISTCPTWPRWPTTAA